MRISRKEIRIKILACDSTELTCILKTPWGWDNFYSDRRITYVTDCLNRKRLAHLNKKKKKTNVVGNPFGSFVLRTLLKWIEVFWSSTKVSKITWAIIKQTASSPFALHVPRGSGVRVYSARVCGQNYTLLAVLLAKSVKWRTPTKNSIFSF